MTLRRAIAFGVAAGVAALVGWKGLDRFYLRPRAKLADDIAMYRGDIRAKQSHIKELKQVRQRLAEIATTTLAVEPDALEHRLRTELVALAEASGLAGVEVKGARPSPRFNPVINSRVRERQPLRAQLRERPDFYVARATLEAHGGLADVATALAMLQGQPWVARIESFTIKPESSDKRLFSLRVDLTTLFVPDLVPRDALLARLAQLEEQDLERARRLAAVNVFRVPDPPPPVIAQKEPPPAPPPAPAPAPALPPYGDWRLAGVMRGASGPAAILVNSRTRETRTLAPGEDVLGFVFIAGSGEEAEFDREGEKFVLRNGQTLAQRDQVD